MKCYNKLKHIILRPRITFLSLKFPVLPLFPSGFGSWTISLWQVHLLSSTDVGRATLDLRVPRQLHQSSNSSLLRARALQRALKIARTTKIRLSCPIISFFLFTGEEKHHFEPCKWPNHQYWQRRKPVVNQYEDGAFRNKIDVNGITRLLCLSVWTSLGSIYPEWFVKCPSLNAGLLHCSVRIDAHGNNQVTRRIFCLRPIVLID